ncbi:MAG: class I SAM-dependent methyltransferase [Pyrinomonadaceae bacterium]
MTGNPNVRISEKFAAADIVELYFAQENINVERYFDHGATIYLLECMDTGYRFYYPFSVVGDAEFYKELQNAHEKRGEEYDRDWEGDHQAAFDEIPSDSTVLEIGCNTGKFLKRVRGKTPNVFGLEFNPLAAEKARQKLLTVFDETVEIHSTENSEKYDVVCAFQVLEHIAEVKSFLQSIAKALKPNGKLILSVPNNEPFYQRFSKYDVLNLPPHHVGLWNLRTFEKLGDFYDFKLVRHKFLLPSRLLVDVYLRAKFYANVKSLPRKHSLTEKMKITAMAPFALLRSSIEYIGTNPNYAHVVVVFEKK